MSPPDAPRIGFVVGETSGDELAGGIGRALQARFPDATFHGVGGTHLTELGLRTLFDADELAIVGVTAVLAKLPRLLHLIRMTTDALVQAELDVLVLVDAPDFTHRVAKRFRTRAPNVPIVKVIAPTVWAWRPERAAKLKPLVDEVLAIFPHEPEVMARLDGPPTTFIGHPLTTAPFEPDWARRASEPPLVLALPGSRRTEIERLAGPFGDALGVLAERFGPLEIVVPTTGERSEQVAAEVARWPVPARVVTAESEKRLAFAQARAALAASGTVTLELALADVPTIAAYKLDALERQVAKRITSWAMAMPNIIADYLVVPEAINELVRPERLARQLERLLGDTPERAAQLEGFARVREGLATGQAPAENAAERIAPHLSRTA